MCGGFSSGSESELFSLLIIYRINVQDLGEGFNLTDEFPMLLIFLVSFSLSTSDPCLQPGLGWKGHQCTLSLVHLPMKAGC